MWDQAGRAGVAAVCRYLAFVGVEVVDQRRRVHDAEAAVHRRGVPTHDLLLGIHCLKNSNNNNNNKQQQQQQRRRQTKRTKKTAPEASSPQMRMPPAGRPSYPHLSTFSACPANTAGARSLLLTRGHGPLFVCYAFAPSRPALQQPSHFAPSSTLFFFTPEVEVAHGLLKLFVQEHFVGLVRVLHREAVRHLH
jgi:hypothetical protein